MLSLFRPFRACLILFRPYPRALPWADLLCPFRAKIETPSGSIPDIPFVKRDFVSLEKESQFLLEGHLSVMLFLIGNVVLDLLDIRLAHRKCGVAVLPVEIFQSRGLLLHPF